MPYPKFNLIKYPVVKQVYFLKKTLILMYFSSIFFNFDICSGTDYGRPMKPFFIEIQNFWAWAENLGR